MVTFKGSSKFYSRASNGKSKMDVGEIRLAFIQSDTRFQRTRDFVQSRVSDIYSGIYPVPMTNFPKLVLHIIPISSTEIQILENFHRLGTLLHLLIPLFTTGANPSFNSDGFISYSGVRNGSSRGYVQIFRNGVIEASSSFLSNIDDPALIPINRIEWSVIGVLRNYTTLLKLLNVEPPAYVFMSLTGVKGLTLPNSNGYIGIEDSIPIQKDIITLPNIELQLFGPMTSEEEFHQLTKSLKISFDALSNSVGLPRSLSYDEEGEWIRRLSN
jgi:hypothetical protein